MLVEFPFLCSLKIREKANIFHHFKAINPIAIALCKHFCPLISSMENQWNFPEIIVIFALFSDWVINDIGV